MDGYQQQMVLELWGETNVQLERIADLLDALVAEVRDIDDTMRTR